MGSDASRKLLSVTPVRLASAAVLISCAALAIALYSLTSRSTGGEHRCGTEGRVVTCISSDTPTAYRSRGCIPRGSEGRVTIWECPKP
jgi:hypothetical protein